MKIITFQSLEKITTTKYKTQKIKNVVNGISITEELKTGIPEKVITKWKLYHIPVDKITILSEFDNQYKINDIPVSEETFKNVLKELKDGV